MNTIFFDSDAKDEMRRKHVFNGQIFVFSPRPSSIALCDLARELTQEAFGSLDPREAQFSLPVEKFVEIVAPLKPRFIHHPKSKQLIQELLEDMGCEMDKTYFDVPRMRVVCHGTYLNAGVGYPLHPHRDTWYAAPLCQMNWWLPLYDYESDSSMAFQPRYWSQPVKNGSSEYNHYEWNREARKNAAQHIKKDTRKQPRPEEHIDLDPQIRVVTKPGAIILFSGAHLHWTVPNTSGRTRFSIDFRTVHLDDVTAKGGAPNLDSAPQGTTLRELMRGSDRAYIPDEIIALYDNEPPPNEEGLLFQPPEEVLNSIRT
ncbi:hypothetical protein [Coleofasciculus sp. FACHB-1120]|uniref:hypothetical protein n=1 Tax=Coleofasciculus sp. FACHB-1120 TaxID=2692783 RepID=UPI00168523D3|nr:hypothetical protein [Coleofasciculus sp. FACHB-1120]MBD2744104.1 hypothetical protein [Coleofasciculus sp. FACHB-1120]